MHKFTLEQLKSVPSGSNTGEMWMNGKLWKITAYFERGWELIDYSPEGTDEMHFVEPDTMECTHRSTDPLIACASELRNIFEGHNLIYCTCE